jgi:hypothetical protein
MNPETTTIRQARDHMSEHFDEGTKCPCCGQFVKKYKRKLNSGMVRTLIQIYRHHPTSYVHVKDMLKCYKYPNSHDWTLLKHWGILTVNDRGMYKITQMGMAFLGGAPTHSHIYMYNNKMMGFAGDSTTISEAYGEPFSLTELMA